MDRNCPFFRISINILPHIYVSHVSPGRSLVHRGSLGQALIAGPWGNFSGTWGRFVGPRGNGQRSLPVGSRGSWGRISGPASGPGAILRGRHRVLGAELQVRYRDSCISYAHLVCLKCILYVFIYSFFTYFM